MKQKFPIDMLLWSELHQENLSNFPALSPLLLHLQSHRRRILRSLITGGLDMRGDSLIRVTSNIYNIPSTN